VKYYLATCIIAFWPNVTNVISSGDVKVMNHVVTLLARIINVYNLRLISKNEFYFIVIFLSFIKDNFFIFIKNNFQI